MEYNPYTESQRESYATAQGTATPPITYMGSVPLLQPQLPFAPSDSTNRDSEYSTAANSYKATEKPIPVVIPPTHGYKERRRKKRWVWLALLGVLAIIVVAVIVPVYFTVIKPKKSSSSSSAVSTGTSGSDDNHGAETTSSVPNAETNSNLVQTTGEDGSTTFMDNGESFVYTNKFGGYWVSDPENPFSNDARANSWTPALNTSWRWGVDRIKGVNLGGLFVLEPFISPALFQAYPGSVDEWTISTLMAAGPGGMSVLEDHYREFITEQDIAQIAGAGLNWIRVPIPYWAIEVWGSETSPGPPEPFLARTCWPYLLRLIGWARKYGIRVNLDLHTIPGSQNGYNHSGKLGQTNFLLGPMGLANAQRALGYIRTLAEFFSQDEYREVVGIFSVVNEALVSAIGQNVIASFYNEVHTMLRSITGIGEGNGPFIAIHDGFTGLSDWHGFMTGSDRIMLDLHPYFSFDISPSTDPMDTGVGASAGGQWPERACERWGGGMNTSRTAFGVTIAGEWSNGFNDCGLFLKGTQTTQHNWPGSCDLYMDASQWSDGLKAGLLRTNLAQMDAFGDWFFWTWKIGNSTSGHVEAPLWSYKLGLEMGFIPADPREADGFCAGLGIAEEPFPGTYSAWQTGGAGAGTLLSTVAWPPSTISAGMRSQSLGVLALDVLPTYTSTGPAITMPAQTLTFTTSADGAMKTEIKTGAGNGWFNAQDNTGAAMTVAGCAGVGGYLDPWDAMGRALPTVICGPSATARTPLEDTLATPTPTVIRR